MKVRRVTPFLWFEDKALEAARFYCRIFDRSKIHSSSPMGVIFELDGQVFHALNGGPHYKLTPAFSVYVHCKDQKEVDYYWTRLLKGGEPSRCGWLVDKFGLSWQVIPAALERCLYGKNRAGAGRAMAAMMQMVKLDVAALEAAYRGE
jgi:predicted 3-demethylubiquinone-9 3-methyltransferase (glyoxalase superfamily)